MGAWTYLAGWDVHRTRVFGRGEVKSGIAPVDRLVGEVMGWILDAILTQAKVFPLVRHIQEICRLTQAALEFARHFLRLFRGA